MGASLRFPESREAAAARVAREVSITSAEQLADVIAPGRALEVDGVRWSVGVIENHLGEVVAHAAIAGLLRVSAAVPRRGRALDDHELVRELEHELREFIDVALERLLETADRMREARCAR